MSDKNLQQLVADELEFEPSVNAAHIGVTADEGVIALTGHVGSYAEKMAAEHAAARVAGVKGIANEIEVRYPGGSRDSDDEIAKRALQVLSWDLTVPRDKIKVEVQKGWVTLTGEVEWYFEKSAAESDVHKLHGVVGVINRIQVEPKQVQTGELREKIAAALRREAQLDANSISVTADGGKVTLTGKVHTWHERNLAERTAWSAPGVIEVEDRLAIA